MTVPRNPKQGLETLPAVDKHIIREILGYLNFSNGKPDPKFRFNWNQLFAELDLQRDSTLLESLLRSHLHELKGTTPAFQSIDQAEKVLKIAFEECLPQYTTHHRDLHGSGDERAWWRAQSIDPEPVAKALWADSNETTVISRRLPGGVSLSTS